MHQTRGFTLIELLVTVAIIGILAMIAVPQYSDYVLRSKIPEATDVLSAMRVRMEQHFLDNRDYRNTAGDACGVAVPADTKYWDFDCEAEANTYVVTATGKASGGTDGFTFSIDQSNVRSTTVDASKAPSGWTGNAACWVTRKGGVC